MATRPAVAEKSGRHGGNLQKEVDQSGGKPCKDALARHAAEEGGSDDHAEDRVRGDGGGARHSKKQANALLAAMIETVIKHLKNGDRIRMNGLGILEVKDRPARQGRNPATGEIIQIAASKKVAFRPAKELKEAV